MGKIVLLGALIAFGGAWYFHFARQMSREGIDAQYQAESAALAKLDAEFLCDQLADDYRDEGASFTLSGTRRHSRGKQESCNAVDGMFDDIRRINAIGGGAFGLSFEHRVLDVQLADDRKTATVEAIGTIRIAGRLLSKTQYVDRLIRRNGRILHAASTSKSWVYVPAGN
jgi:hypothetical protein